jgi:hypothetical protein
VSRTIDRRAEHVSAALRVIGTARATARRSGLAVGRRVRPDHQVDTGRPLVIDVEGATPTFKRGCGNIHSGPLSIMVRRTVDASVTVVDSRSA